MTNTRMTDPELLDKRFPVRVHQSAIRRGSGDQGKWCGGDGITRQLEFLVPVTVTTLSSHRLTEPAGRDGGGNGMTGVDTVIRADGNRELLKGNDQSELLAGEVIEMHTPGGGGWGD